MKWMIASDLHGSAACTRRLLERMEQEQPEKLILLGDLLYHGPRNDLPEEYDPKKVAAMLNQRAEKLICIRGNCDSEVDQMMLDFPVLADYAFLHLNGHLFFASHGHHHNPATPPKGAFGGILLNGHTHVPKAEPYEGFLYLNPGSVSIPKENSPHSYLVLEENRLMWKDLSGEVYMEHTL